MFKWVITFGILSFLISAFLNNGINKKLLKRESIICFTSLAIICMFWKISDIKWTIYEFLLASSEAVITIHYFIFLLEKKESPEIITLKSICINVLVIAVFSILTYGRTCISSDTATASILAESQIKHQCLFPETWNYANGDIWVLKLNIIVLFLMNFIKDQSLVRTMASVFIVTITAAGMAYHSRNSFKDKSWMLSIPLFLVFLYGASDMILYQAMYTDQMLWLVLLCSILYKIYTEYEKRKCNRFIFIYGIIMILLLTGGVRMMAEQTVPVVITCFIMLYADARLEGTAVRIANAKKFLYMSGVILIPSGVGYGIYKWLCSWHNVNNTNSNAVVFTVSLQSAIDSLRNTFCNIYSCFGYTGNVSLNSIAGVRNMLSIFVCTCICFIIPYLQTKKIRSELCAVRFFYIFGITHNIIMLILSVFFGKSAASRYILSSIFVMIIISSRYMFAYWVKSAGLDKVLFTGVFAAAVAIECIGIGCNSIGWTKNLYARKELNNQLLAHGLTKGYATYWYAYTNEVYSDFKIRYGGVDLVENGIEPHLWLVDSDVYEEEDTGSFLLLTPEENEWYQSKGQFNFERPVERFTVNNLYVYAFDYDIIRK